ncbi:outer membrane beta-barrel protein [uncultured Prevotella sp.]|uniref:outer membrane beta-barrel protein n=1 Tax=uncultured Prevotella sp. TaxID=159272 RepID=UPI00260A4697|nr:outer membrane beta-barrel protein [uncultured Prevotella sp.]
MKQEDWTGQMRRRLADRETPAPDDLWEKIEMRLDAAAPKPVLKPRYTIRRIAMWSASAAAVAALLVAVGYQANVDTIEQLAANTPKTAAPNAEPRLVAASNSRSTENAAPHTRAAYNEVAATDDVEAIATSNNQEAEERASVSLRKAESNQSASVARTEAHTPQYTVARAMYAGDGKAVEPTSRWSIGAYTGGSMTDGNYANIPVARCANASMLDDAYTDNSSTDNNGYRPVGNAALLSRYNETKHHAQPVSYGLSFGYALNNRLTLTTGVVYTRAVTDFIRSSGNDNITETQRLHYIGVPIGVKYRVWGNRYIQTYATAGGQADFNVKATMTSGDVKTDVDCDNVQFSVNAAAGVQVDVVPHVGLYAEPGVKYYIDNKSAVATIFKDKPWAFNLQVGLRVEF